MQKNNQNIKYNKFICDFHKSLDEIRDNYTELVFLCIGTDKMTGDCFGPLVGNYIKNAIKQNIISCKVYGDLENPLVFSNIEKILKKINNTYKKPFIIAIDAALSKQKKIGEIIVKKGGIKFGFALSKEKGEIGDISIKAIVGENYKKVDKNMQLLQSTSLNLVMNLAIIVSDGIIEVLKEENRICVI